MSLVGAYLSVHTPRYCTLEAGVEGRLASEVFRPVRDGLVVDGTPRHRGVLTAQEVPEIIHGYGPSSGSGNYVISLLAHGAQA